jgi:diguanylate cyclase (GGDEF)-like protein
MRLGKAAVDGESFILESPLLPFFAHSFDGIALARADPWRLVYANATLAAWIGCSTDALRTRRLDSFISTLPVSTLLETSYAVWQGNAPEATLFGLLHSDLQHWKPVEFRLVRIVTPQEPLLGILVREVERAPFNIVPAYDGRRDPLTGLRDRAFLLAHLEALLKGEHTSDHQFAVLFIDLDNFKRINDAYGHLVGDGVLAEIAGRLSECVRDGDFVVRFGGDEFVVLIERIADRRDVHAVVGRIHAALEAPITLPEGNVQLSVSIGIAEASPLHRSPEDLLAAADRAMYESKKLRS